MGRPPNDPAKVLPERMQVDENGCWLWTGPRDHDGYGKITVYYRTRGAHRVAYELWVGPVPEGMQLDHLCRIRHCINPEHMEPVTLVENIRRGHRARGVASGRENISTRDAARKRYDKRKALGLPGPYPGESRDDYHARVDNAYHSVHADLYDNRERRGLSDMRRDLGRTPTAQEWQDERR